MRSQHVLTFCLAALVVVFADPEPQGSIVFQRTQPLSGPDRRPTQSLDYQQKFWEGRNGHFGASGGALQSRGGRWEPHVGLQGTYRFRRSADPEPQGSIVFQRTQPLSGPDRRPTQSLDYQQKFWEGRNGHFGASGGALQSRGGRWEPHVGLQGTYRFRRSADPEPQGSIVFQRTQPLSGPDRRPTQSLDYQQKFWEGRNGHFGASGGALQSRGGRWEPHVGLQGTYRFRRSADPEPQGSIVFQRTQPLSGPDRRPTQSLDYQQKLWEGRNGHFGASGGALQSRGGRWEPHVGLQGTYRFRRSADPEPQSLDYQQKPLEGRNGDIGANGGAQQLPDGESAPHEDCYRFSR